MTKAQVCDALTTIERRYKAQAAIAQTAMTDGHITVGEYLEQLETAKLAHAAAEEYRQFWLMKDEGRIELLTQFHVGIPRAAIVKALWALRQQLEAEGALDLRASLLLYDVCECLGLDVLETESVLGFEGTRQVEHFKAEKVMEVVEPVKAPTTSAG